MSAADQQVAITGERHSRPGVAGRQRHRHPLLWFVARRLVAGVVTLLFASFMIFLATNALPGNVAETVLGRNATPELVAKLNHQLHLDEPVLTRYGNWLIGTVRGDLGESAVAVVQGNPESSVTSLIGIPLRNSVVLALISIVCLIPISLLLGTFAAVRAGRAGDYAVSYISLVIGALPEFVFGTLLIAIFFSGLGLFPPVSLIPPGTSPLADVGELVLPVLTLLGVSVAFCARQVRAGVLDTLSERYVTMARLSGISEVRVLWRYALRNALAPSVQTFAQALQYLFGGIIVVETLFAYPGIGQALVQAVTLRDVSSVLAVTFVLAGVYIAINVLADVIVVLAVPKLRTGLR
ncbi:ABC transporter permease [Nocardioides zhouii]|nr:ABC transporter permease [Nocardioides zhouii]